MRDEPHRRGSTRYLLDERDIQLRQEDYDVEAFGLLLGRFGRPVATAPPPQRGGGSESEGDEGEGEDSGEGEVKSLFAAQHRTPRLAAQDTMQPMRLLHVKGRGKVKVWQVPLDWTSLNSGKFPNPNLIGLDLSQQR